MTLVVNYEAFWPKIRESAEFLSEYVDACCTIGASVRVEGVAGSVVFGTVSGINADGALLVKIDDGSTVAIQSGDVVHVR